MRAAAEVDPVALAVQGDGFRGGQVLNKLGLVFLPLRLEEGDGLVPVDHPALKLCGTADNVPHLGLYGGEVVRGERLVAGEVVVETVLD